MNHDDLATAPVLHAPFRRMALCLDCEAAFPIAASCPACGSTTFTLIAKFLEGGHE